MIIIDILYNLTIYPIEFIIEIIFYLFNNIFEYDYSLSFFILSLFVSIMSLPFYNVAELWAKRERDIQDIMKRDIEHINKNFKGDEKFLLTRACYKIYGYKTIYAFRETLGLLIQIPFFLAAYNFIHNLSGLQLGSFLFIKDFSKPDAILNIGNISVNILPFVMTLFSLLSGLVYSKKLRFKESLPLYIVSLIFLVLLYNSPSGLVFYWTLNCLFSFIKNIVIEYKLINIIKNIMNKFDKKQIFNIYKIFVCLGLYLIIIASIFNNTNKIETNKYFLVIFGILVLLSILLNKEFMSFIKNKILQSKMLKNIINILTVIITIAFILLSILGNMERKGYVEVGDLIQDKREIYNYNFRISYYDKIFRNSDIYGIIVNTNKLDRNIYSIEFEKYGSPFGIIKLHNSIENVGKIEVYYKLFIKNTFIGIFILFITLFIIFNNIYKYIFNILSNIISDSFLEKRNLLIISSCLVISILSGLFIPSSLIGNSPTEFKSPFDLIINDFSMSLGLFLFYPLFLYILFSKNIKNYLTLLLIFIASFVLVNTFIMKGNYININADFVFDNTDLLKASFKEILLTIILTVILISIIILIIKNKKLIFIINIYSIILLALIGVSIFDISKIIKEQKKLSESQINNDKSSDIKIFNMSKTGENVFVFVLDRAINSYWLDAFERFPDYKKDFDGFVFYPNTVSFAGSTTTIASLYGGYDYLPYEMSIDGNYDITNFHNEALLMLPLALKEYDYKSIYFEPTYANFSWVPDLKIFKDYTNISAYNNNTIEEYSLNKYSKFQINKSLLINRRLIRFSVFRMLPINLRYYFYNDKGWFNPNLNINSSIYHYAILHSIKDFINITNEGNYYNNIHNMITHEPYYFSSDFLPYLELKQIDIDKKYLDIYKDDISVRHFYANVASINCITNFINYLKENDIYDNTKIIIVSDHGAVWLNTTIFKNENISFINAYNSLLMYKDFNSKGEIKIETNFMTIADMPYLATKHIPNIKNPFNNKLITNDYKNNIMHLIQLNNWQTDKQLSNRYDFYYYYNVKENIFDINNWKKFQIDWKTKETKEIEIK